ncbi:hypothetical protein SAMN04487910_1976 [Aquimarina amphilecti]|uniref:Uncharacterized protein n=1 Tax=Aquimarina amphilecti TaxID=1038014 RepID=A0A1H7N733_AQUAM|nr:hypothetical protein SAMN04487910_1976 [Aquimarina amphilecti]
MGIHQEVFLALGVEEIRRPISKWNTFKLNDKSYLSKMAFLFMNKIRIIKKRF